MTNDPHGIAPDEATRAIDALDEQPSVDSLFEQIARMGSLEVEGWGEISDAGQALARQRADMARQTKAEANVFRDTFSTPAGRRCLAIMRTMTLDTAPYPSEAMLPLDAITPLVLVHDAQCRFVRSIFEAIAQAENTTLQTKGDT